MTLSLILARLVDGSIVVDVVDHVQVLVVEDVIEVVHAAVDDVVHGVGDFLGQDGFLVSSWSLLLDWFSASLTPVNFLDSIGDQTGDGFGLCPAIREI